MFIEYDYAMNIFSIKLVCHVFKLDFYILFYTLLHPPALRFSINFKIFIRIPLFYNGTSLESQYRYFSNLIRRTVPDLDPEPEQEHYF